MTTMPIDATWSDAKTCRANGWKAGTRLEGNDHNGTVVIEITAIGDDILLARQVEPVKLPEATWTLRCRHWYSVQ